MVYSLLLFLFAPGYFSLTYCQICTASYFFYIYIYYKEAHKTNYLDFDTMFFIAFFLVSFLYPTFVYPVNPQIYWIFQYSMDEGIIMQSTALSLLGILAFMYGSITYRPRPIVPRRYKHISTRGLFCVSVMSFLLYIAFGGYAALKGSYESGVREEGGLYGYFSILVNLCIFCMITAWFMNSYQKSRMKIQWKCFPIIQILYIVLYMTLLVLAGSRNKVLTIILLSGGLYAYLYHPFTLRKVLIFSMVGMVAMFGILSYRSGLSFSINSFAGVALDLLITNHNTFDAMSIVQEEGLSYGRSMLAYVLGMVPFLQNIVFTLADINPDTTNSAMIITQYTLGTTDGTGTGTTIIADIYLAFGTVGVILFMGFLGRFIHRLLDVAKYNIYYLLVYGILMGMSVYIARAEFFYPAKTLLWSCLCMYIAKHCVVKYRHHLETSCT